MLAQADELDELDGAHVDIPLAYYSNLLIQLMAMLGKGAQSDPTSAPESGDGASDHVSTSEGDKISLDDVIAKLRAADKEDKRAQEILAAATTLRDCSGRDRKDALRKMANAWGVTLNEKVGAKYTPRLGSALAEDIQASVCKAALDWESGAARHAVVEEASQSSSARPSSREDEGAAVKKNKNHWCCRAWCGLGNRYRGRCPPTVRDTS